MNKIRRFRLLFNILKNNFVRNYFNQKKLRLQVISLIEMMPSNPTKKMVKGEWKS
jgi:hypothetical protein